MHAKLALVNRSLDRNFVVEFVVVKHYVYQIVGGRFLLAKLPMMVALLFGVTNIMGQDSNTNGAQHILELPFNCELSLNNQVCREVATGLPARVLPRSYSQLYQEPRAEESLLIPIPVAPFRPLYVFNQNVGEDGTVDTGWYQVGSNERETLGWIQGKDAMQWKQALIVSYTHPGGLEGRNPILMFDSISALERVLQSDDMLSDVENIYQQIETVGSATGIISMEPKRFVDIRETPYFLPITDWREEEIEGEEIRLLKISAAVPNKRGADTMENPTYRDNVQTPRREASTEMSLKNKHKLPTVDIVFVVDTTLSMQPYINRTRDVIRQVAQKIESTLPSGAKFGLVGYRDSTVHMPKIGYVANNYTPELVSAYELGDVLASVKATKVDSKDEAEEVFAGIQTAIDANWQSDNFKFIILIGDASGHDYDHPHNTTSSNHIDIKRELVQNKIHLLAMHLQSNRRAALKDKPIALMQYGHLSEVDGTNGKSALVEVDTTVPGDFERAVSKIMNQFFDNYGSAIANRQPTGESIDTESDPSHQIKQDQSIAAVNMVFQAALIEYIGQAATAPKDISTWVVDRDLTDLSYPSLQVHVVLNKEQLSSLYQALEQVLTALKQADSSQQEFFTALQQVAGQAMKQPEGMAGSDRLSDMDLLPKFINDLPYKSDILFLDNAMFASMSASQRAMLEASLSAKLDQYRRIVESSDLWQLTNPDDPSSAEFYPLPLEFLP